MDSGLIVSIILLQFLGWRVGTVLRLKCAHIELKGSYIVIKASHCKTEATSGLPEGVFSLSQCPHIAEFVLTYVRRRLATDTVNLFDIPGEGRLALWFNDRLGSLFRDLGIHAVGSTSHCFRRGTTSTLLQLGMSTKTINRHVGWAVRSQMIDLYERTVHLREFDRLFFHDVVCGFPV